MALTLEMADWLTKHTSFSSAGFLKKKALSSEMEKFWRRKAKVEEAIKALPTDSKSKPGLLQRLAKITDPLEQGTNANPKDLKTAYDALDQLKKDARTASQLECMAVNVQEIQTRLLGLNNSLVEAARVKSEIMPRVTKAYDWLHEDLKQYTAVNDAPDKETALKIYSINYPLLAAAEYELGFTEEAAKSEAPTFRTAHIAPLGNPDDLTKLLDHSENDAQLKKQKDPTADVTLVFSLTAQMRALIKTEKLLDLGELEGKIQTKINTEREAFLQKKRELLSFSNFQERQNPDPRTQPQDEHSIRPDAFEHLEMREEARLQSAFVQMDQDRRRDQQAIGAENVGSRSGDIADPDAPQRKKPQRFDTNGLCMLIGDFPMEHEDQSACDSFVKSVGVALKGEIDELLKNKPQGDAMRDLACKTPEEWVADYMSGFGFFGSIDDLPERPRNMLLQMGKDAAKLVQNSYPNTCTADASSFTLDGKTFKRVKVLGSGGGGEASLYEDDQGNKLVLKTPLLPKGEVSEVELRQQMEEKRGEFANEARNHNQASGGADAPANRSVLDLKGIVLTPDGVPLVAMEFAGGGDLSNLATTNQAAKSGGLISEEALQAMNRENLREVAKGMASMKENGLVHADMKELNVFLSEDGRMKVADFGLTKTQNEQGQVHDASDGGTKSYTSPERWAGELTDQSDVFSLGVMMKRMNNPELKAGKYGYGGLETQGKDSAGQVNENTAFDRLANAMLEPDPEKRAPIESVLMSTYLDESDNNYTPEDLEKLRKANTAYSKAAGKEIAPVQKELTTVKGHIYELELELNGRKKEAILSDLERKRLEMAADVTYHRRKVEQTATDDPSYESRVNAMKNSERYLKDHEQSIEEAKKKSYEISETERRKKEEDLKTSRKKVVELNHKIKVINAKKEIAPYAEALEKANAPFTRISRESS